VSRPPRDPKKRRVVRRSSSAPIPKPEYPSATHTVECKCGALTVIFDQDDRVIIRTTTERGAGWMKLFQWVVCSHCNTEIRYAPLLCWEGKESGELYSTKFYMGAGIEGERRPVPPREGS